MAQTRSNMNPISSQSNAARFIHILMMAVGVMAPMVSQAWVHPSVHGLAVRPQDVILAQKSEEVREENKTIREDKIKIKEDRAIYGRNTDPVKADKKKLQADRDRRNADRVQRDQEIVAAKTEHRFERLSRGGATVVKKKQARRHKQPATSA